MTSPGVPYAEVIGDPIDHSLSPGIHCFWLKQLGFRAGYRRHLVRRRELTSYLEERRSDPNWRGCNVTMPLKLDALAVADQPSDRALAAGAANLLISRDGRLLAGNTDVGAVVTLVEKLARSGASMGSVTVLGSGGGARAALVALRLMGIASVTIQARNLKDAYALAVQFGLNSAPRPFDAVPASDGLINATPLGMSGQPDCPVELSGLPRSGWVLDFVSSPAPTALVRCASQAGIACADGIQMLVEQAAESFRLLFGVDAPRDRDEQLLARLRG